MTPLIDLKAQYQDIEDEVQAAIQRVLSSARFIGGAEVKLFEEEFASFCGVGHAVACGNGTDALELVLDAWGIGPGDEVIVPAVSWISTSEVVVTRGAKAVFVDVDPSTNCLPLAETEAAITDRTKAIILVHLYGYPAAAAEFRALADRHNLLLLEDCAQAHGAECSGRRVGAFGHAATFSFFPSKSLGAFGDAGCVVTADEQLSSTVRALANHGMRGRRHVHTLHGRNSRMDSLQAAILRVKLRRLPHWLVAKRTLMEHYNRGLAELSARRDGFSLPPLPSGGLHGAHLYAPVVMDRAGLTAYLARHDVQTAVHYPTPLPLHRCYDPPEGTAARFPHATKLCSGTLSLPLYAELPPERVADICRTVVDFYEG